MYGGVEGLFQNDDAEVAGGNLMGRWTRRYSGTRELQVHAYYDRTYRHVPGQFEEKRHTVDVEAIHRMRYGTRHQLVFGGNFRLVDGRDIGTAGFRFVPERKTDMLVSLFVQDEIALRPDRVYLRDHRLGVERLAARQLGIPVHDGGGAAADDARHESGRWRRDTSATSRSRSTRRR